MLATVPSATLLGVDGRPVRVEVHVSSGLPGFTVVGLPDASCRESRDRVRSALMSSGMKWPMKRVTVNLAPTHVRKAGAGLDLAIALALLAADEQLPVEHLRGWGFIGELGLDGSLRPVVGTLPLAAVCRRRPVVPLGGLGEARLTRADAVGARSLAEAVQALAGELPWPEPDPAPVAVTAGPFVAPVDLGEVRGQAVARAALEVAAAGGHHLLMVGPPGAGKTMLAERLPGLMPDLTDNEALDVTRVHSAAGRLDGREHLIRRPPFRSPHHTASMTALIGGGSNVLRPGEVSLASCGVLFLDELGEFPVSHLDALRQPLESGVIQVSRANISVELPARVLLVAATNPCPCGVGRWGECRCSEAQLTRYARRLCGPLVDRFDLRLGVGPADPRVVFLPGEGESSETVRRRVEAARLRAAGRGVTVNRQLRGRDLRSAAPLSADAERVLREQLERGVLTMRGADRTRAVALTLADLAGLSPPLCRPLVEQALALRGGDAVIGPGA